MEEEGREMDGLPEGWELVLEHPPAQSYLWSPAVSSDGKEVKRVKVFSYGKLLALQGPSSRFPQGRFHEIREHHFPWAKKRVQQQVGTVHCREAI